MMILTRAQRVALKALYDRAPVFAGVANTTTCNMAYAVQPLNHLTYRQFRKYVIPEMVGKAIMIPWAGMWVGIEPDGYTHT